MTPDRTNILDTNTVTDFIAAAEPLTSRIRARELKTYLVSAVTVDEILTGWYSRLRKAKTPFEIEEAYTRLIISVRCLAHFRLVPFSLPAIVRYEALKKLKLNVGGNDLRIAAIALELNATVVSANLRDFTRVPDLKVEDWSQ